MGRKKTHEQYVKELELLNNGIKVIGIYHGNNIKILHECANCHQWKTTPKSILNGYKCPICFGNKKKTHEEFVQDVINFVGDIYEFIGKYNGNKKKIKVRHKECGYVWDAIPQKLLDKRNSKIHCPKCNGCIRYNTEIFSNEIYKLTNGEYKIVGEYINSKTPIKILHDIPECQFEYFVRPNDIKRGHLCPSCIRKNRLKGIDKFKEEVFSLVGNEYSIIGEYINGDAKIKIIHNVCKKEFEMSPHSFLKGSRCLVCNETKGERKIRHWLEENNIEFKSQKEFDGLVGLGGGLLSYDFFSPKLNLLIEYQGEQHDRFIKWFHGIEYNFIKQLKHDKIKRKYANDNSITLLEIWYWDYDNIEKILERELIR
jgi:hypothetical protein